MLQLGRKVFAFLLATVTALVAISPLIACQPKHESIDERQAAVIKANASLSKMETLQTDLKTVNLSLEKPDIESKSILLLRESELVFAKTKLEEFIAAGNSVLHTAKRTDVMWSGQKELDARLAIANSLLSQITSRMEKPTELLGTRFWEIRDACFISLSNGVEVGGVRWHSLHSFDERQIQKLSRDQRLDLAKQIREQIACDEIVQRSYQVLYGSSRSALERTDKTFWPLVAKLEAAENL